MLRNIASSVIALCVIYFLGGWLAVQFGWLDEQKYFAYSGVVGGLASVAGVLSLLRPGITNSDLQSIEVEALKSVTKVSEELEGLEYRKLQATAEVDSLAIKQKEMELLVRKASLALFLREQCDRYQKKVAAIIESNNELRESLQEYRDAREKITAINEEIETDPNTELLYEVIDAAKRRTNAIEDAINDLPPIFRTVILSFRALLRVYAKR